MTHETLPDGTEITEYDAEELRWALACYRYYSLGYPDRDKVQSELIEGGGVRIIVPPEAWPKYDSNFNRL